MSLRTALASVVAIGALLSPDFASGGVVPLPTSGNGFLSHAAYLNGPSRSDEFSIPQGSAQFASGFNPSVISQSSPNLSSTARGGFGWSQSSTQVRVTLRSGVGVGQSDPNGAYSRSELFASFIARWSVRGGTFGPPLTTAFSIPIGVKLGAGGSASVDYDINWEAMVGSQPIPLRSPFNGSRAFAGAQTTLINITAPAQASTFSSLPDGSEIVIRGTLSFKANNDEEPALIEIPTAENFGSLLTPEFNYEPGAIAGEVPEPAAAGGIAVAGLLALGRRRRQSARAITA